MPTPVLKSEETKPELAVGARVENEQPHQVQQCQQDETKAHDKHQGVCVEEVPHGRAIPGFTTGEANPGTPG